MNIADKLEKLANLRDTGTLTEQEFQVQKTKLLSSFKNENFEKTNTAEKLKENKPETQKSYGKYIYLALPLLVAVGFGIGKLANKPSSISQPNFEDGMQAIKSGDYDKALKILVPLANEGKANAQTSLGTMYFNGNGVSKDYVQAEHWYRIAAEQGFTKAQYNLGLIYGTGQGVQKDPVQAVNWFSKAADKGLADAQLNLGNIYNTGQGVPQDNTQAVHWFRKAAEQGLANAQYNLGVMYLNGKGVQKDPVQAAQWIGKAADQGFVDAQHNLGVMYLNGEGVQKDPVQAAQWIGKAAEKGLANAQNTLGSMYQFGQGVTKDYNQAVNWYHKAAEQGLAEAQRNLGRMYKNGIGVSEDIVAAVKWYQKAAEQGDVNAQNVLNEIKRESSAENKETAINNTDPQLKTAGQLYAKCTQNDQICDLLLDSYLKLLITGFKINYHDLAINKLCLDNGSELDVIYFKTLIEKGYEVTLRNDASVQDKKPLDFIKEMLNMFIVSPC